jgi:GT2 family glycosyltransferase
MSNLATKNDSEEHLLALLDEKSAIIRDLRAREAHLAGRCVALEHQIASILNSRSWKCTQGLRGISESLRSISTLLGSLFPLWRWRKLSLKLVPLETRGKDVTSYQLIAQDGRKGRVVPGSWVCLNYSLITTKEHQSFFLYYDAGGGFSGNARCLLTLDKGTGSCMVRLPERCLKLRLDPFDSKVPFDLDRLEIQALGKLQVASRWALKQFKQGYSVAALLSKSRKALKVFREGGIAGLKARLGDTSIGHDYEKWVSIYDTLSEADLKKMRAHSFQYEPLISVVMPTYNTPDWALSQAIESVLKQTYENWELCIADDFSTSRDTTQLLEEYARKDSRIKVVFRETNGHISAASNTALGLVRGEFVGLLDHDDELTPDALFQVVAALNANPLAELLYSDEDKITEEGLRHNPYFKSDWNPELLLTQNYICHFTVMRTSTVKQVGGFREGYEGAQDWDLILRVTEQAKEEQIVHIPHILYHWRAIQGSTAAGTLHKPYVLEAQKKSVEQSLARQGVAARVSILEDISQLRVRFAIPEPAPEVALIIPTKDQVDILRTCVTSILEKTVYPNFTITIVDNRSELAETKEYLSYIARNEKVTVLRDERAFNFSAINNRAAALQKAPILGLINNDIEVIAPLWMSELVGSLWRDSVGAVGARLYYPSNILQHGGVVLGIGGVAGHSHKGRPRSDVGYFNRIILPHNVSAVTAACMLVKREVFERVGGLDEGTLSVAFNDVDLCLKIRQLGMRIVYNPHAELYHHESISRGYETTPEKFTRFESEIDVMHARWENVLSCDPYYNPNLTIVAEDFGYAFPPRVEKCWRL